MNRLITSGKRGCTAYFEKSGICSDKKLSHNPFVVFNKKKNGDVDVEIVDNVDELVNNYPSRTRVMNQWRGKKRSDFFRFTVGDLKTYMKSNHLTA